MTLFDERAAALYLQDVAAERELLIAAAVSGALPADLGGLEPDDFTDVLRALLFRAMLHLQAQGGRLSKQSLLERLQSDPATKEYAGWDTFLASCDGEGPSVPSAASARRLRELGRRRRLMQQARELELQALELNRRLPPEERRPDLQGIVVHSAADALKPRPPLEWVVENLVSRGSLSIFYGEPGSKKTYSLLWLAACAARGRSWLNFATRCSRVLFIDEETGHARLAARLAQVLHGALADESTPIRYVSLAGLRLNEPGDVAQLQALIVQEQAELVIVDSLSAVTSGDENSKQEVQPVMTALRNVAGQTSAALVLIHHAGKNGVYRGSSAYKASSDLLVHVSSDDGSPLVSFKTEKNRDGLAMRWAARAAWIEQPDPAHNQFYMEAVTSEKEEKSLGPTKQFVLDYLREKGESARPDIVAAAAEQAAGSQAAIFQAVRELARAGFIRRTNPNERGRGVPSKYALCPGDAETQAIGNPL